MNKTLPYLVSNVIELLDVDPEELGVEEDGGHVDLDSQRKGKTNCCFFCSLSDSCELILDFGSVNTVSHIILALFSALQRCQFPKCLIEDVPKRLQITSQASAR